MLFAAVHESGVGHDSDEPFTAGYVRSLGGSSHAAFALEMT
jgi:hypothetical protein